MWKMKLNLWNNLIILVDWYIKSTRMFWKFQLLFLRGAFHVLFQESADWAQRRSRVGRLWCCMAWVVPLCFFSPPGLRRVSKSTGYSILTSTLWNFKIYILCLKKGNQQFPQQQKKIIGIPYYRRLFSWTNPKKKTSPRKTADRLPGSSTFTQLHVTRLCRNAFAPPLAPPGGWQGLRRPAAVAGPGASGKTAVKVGEIRKVWGVFFCSCKVWGIFMVVSSVQQKTGWIFCLDNC